MDSAGMPINGSSTQDLLQKIRDAEDQRPPKPLDDALGDAPLQAARESLASPNTQLAQLGPKLWCLSKQCLLCAQHMRYAARIKPLKPH